MESNPVEDIESLRKRFEEAGQGHVFEKFDTFCSDYSEAEKEEFLEQCRDIDLDEITKLYNEICLVKKEESLQDDVKPVDSDMIHSFSNLDEATKQKWMLRGAQQINKGTVGLVILAGGMGSRLGSDNPKGMYDIGLPSGKSLFQIIAEKFRRVQRYSTEICQRAGENCAPRYKCMLYIMTSRQNHDATIKFFQDNDFFGIKEDRIMFFMQASLPPLSFDGKIMFETKKKLSLCPNGNGALFKAVASNTDLQDSLKENNIEYVHLVGVDNLMTKFLDPLQVGMTYENELKGSSKYIAKAYPTEPIGVFVKRGKTLDIIEYIHLGEEMVTKTGENGKLMFNQGNVLNFFISVDMLLELCTGKTEVLNSLYNCAVKKIPVYDETKDVTEKPAENNGYKLELFIFSFLPYVEGKFELIEGIREEEFAPVKNKEGEPKDSPTTAREMVSKLHAKWIKKAIPDIEFKDEPSASFVVELPFLSTYEGENITLDMVPKDVVKS